MGDVKPAKTLYTGRQAHSFGVRSHPILRGGTMLYAPKEKGQGLVEYALILVLIAVVVIVILALLGPAIGNVFSNIVSSI
jgi:pilus assembly protein Flp/PilA